MSEPNWKALATELADVQRHLETGFSMTMTTRRAELVDQIRAAATPEPEPMRWPGMDKTPEVIKASSGWYVVVRICRTGGWCHFGPTCSTRAEAVAEWNRVVAALSGGVDEETRAAMDGLCEWVKYGQNVVRVREWLARHPKGGGA